MKYEVLSATRLESLILQVNNCISGGWKLQGGVAVGSVMECMRFYQAVILEEG